MTVRLVGLHAQGFSRDEKGHREYTVTWKVQTDDSLDGPQKISQCPGMFAVGDTYALDNDEDAWAFCTPEMTIVPNPDTREADPLFDYLVTQSFTTSPTKRCQANPIENPLLEPYTISGDFASEQREPKVDKDGKPLIHPNFQQITGSQIQQKYSWPTISIGFNSATLPLSTYVLLINKVNDAPLWELPARCVRFIDAKWERLLYGSCFYYYRTTYTFEFDLDSFDKPVPAFGTTRLREGGDKTNPNDFELIPDLIDESIGAPLTADGYMVDPTNTNRRFQYIQRPKVALEGNLLLLGIPTTLF